MSMPITPDARESLTADQLEWVFREALRTADTQGVEAALRAMVGVDPRRAVELYEATKTALAVAKVLTGGGS